LNLRHVDDTVVDPLRRDTEQLLAVSITLQDAKPLFLDCQNTGVDCSIPSVRALGRTKVHRP